MLAAQSPDFLPLDQWPASKALALLLIIRDACALDCAERMRADGVNARQEDFRDLRIEGYAVKPLGHRYHSLTPFGRRRAEELSRTIARRLGLHHIHRTGDAWNDYSIRCTCGWSSWRSRHERGSSGAVARHLEQIRNAAP